MMPQVKSGGHPAEEQYEGSLREAEDQAGRILEDAKKMGRTEYEKILRQADDDAAKKLEQADRMIGLEREKTLRELQGLTKELAATATEKLCEGKQRPGSGPETVLLHFWQIRGKSMTEQAADFTAPCCMS
ncbi:MAG: ATP synthase F0 subunit B [Clostridium sp.]